MMPLLQVSEREVDNHIPGYIIGDKSDAGQDAPSRVEMGNPRYYSLAGRTESTGKRLVKS